MATNMADIFKMAADKIVVFCISTGILCVQDLINIGSTLVIFFFRSGRQHATKLKMAADQI